MSHRVRYRGAEIIIPTTLAQIPASYIITQINLNGTKIYLAINGETGLVEFSGTDAATVIQSVINALTPGRTWKKRVALKGYFEISDKILIPSYTILDLRGAYLKLADGANVTVIETEQFATHCEIIGGIIDGNKENQNPTGEIYGIKLSASQYSRVIGTTVINVHYDGIIVAGGFRNKIIDVYVKGCGHNGVTFWSSDRTVYRGHLGIGIISEDNGLEGVGLGTVGGVVVSCLATGGNSRGIATDGGQDNIITDHRSDGDEYGAFIAGERIVYKSFVIKNPTKRGIIIKPAGDGTLPDGVKLDTGIILNPAEHGIDIRDSKLIELENVRVIGSGDHGISITGTQNNHEIRIRNCILMNNTGSGVRIGSTDSIIKSVIIHRIKATGNKYGIYFGNNTTSEELIIEDSDLRNNNTSAIYIWGPITTKRIKRNLGYVTENGGVATFSGDGSTTQFQIAHGLVAEPETVDITPLSADAAGDFYVTKDSTYIYVNYLSPPPSGTNNVVLSWRAEV